MKSSSGPPPLWIMTQEMMLLELLHPVFVLSCGICTKPLKPNQLLVIFVFRAPNNHKDQFNSVGDDDLS